MNGFQRLIHYFYFLIFQVSRIKFIKFQLNFIIIFVHAGVDEGFGSDEALFDEAAEIVIPFDVAGAADDVFERAGTAIVVGDGAGDGVVVVLEEFVGKDAALDAVEETLGVDEDEDFREAAEDG